MFYINQMRNQPVEILTQIGMAKLADYSWLNILKGNVKWNEMISSKRSGSTILFKAYFLAEFEPKKFDYFVANPIFDTNLKQRGEITLLEMFFMMPMIQDFVEELKEFKRQARALFEIFRYWPESK